MFLESARAYLAHAAACVLVWCASLPVGALAFSAFDGETDYQHAVLKCCYSGVVASVAVIFPGAGLYASLIILFHRAGRFVGLTLVFLGLCVLGWGLGAALLEFRNVRIFFAAQLVGLTAFASLGAVCMAAGYFLAMCADGLTAAAAGLSGSKKPPEVIEHRVQPRGDDVPDGHEARQPAPRGQLFAELDQRAGGALGERPRAPCAQQL